MQKDQNGPSQRQLRVGEQIKHIIVETLQRGHFHEEVLLDAAANVTVTEVRPSPDLRNATAYVISLGGIDMDHILPALNREAHTFQKEINAKANLKFTPIPEVDTCSLNVDSTKAGISSAGSSSIYVFSSEK